MKPLASSRIGSFEASHPGRAAPRVKRWSTSERAAEGAKAKTVVISTPPNQGRDADLFGPKSRQ